MPFGSVRFVVIGLTNGRSFTRNPCLSEHLAWARRQHTWTGAYAFTTFPTDHHIKVLGGTGPYDGRHWLGRVQNAAWKIAIYNVRSMQAVGFRPPHVWIDVEPSSSRRWPHNQQWNRAVLAAWVKAYRDNGHSVGVYSTRSIWHSIMGGWNPGLPEWRTVGPSAPHTAQAQCRARSFQGGRGVIAQWWDRRRDYDLMCPGSQPNDQMSRFFARL